MDKKEIQILKVMPASTSDKSASLGDVQNFFFDFLSRPWCALIDGGYIERISGGEKAIFKEMGEFRRTEKGDIAVTPQEQ